MFNERKLTRIKPDRKRILKEMRAAASGLKDAEDSFSRDKSHRALLIAINEIFKSGRM